MGKHVLSICDQFKAGSLLPEDYIKELGVRSSEYLITPYRTHLGWLGREPKTDMVKHDYLDAVAACCQMWQGSPVVET